MSEVKAQDSGGDVTVTPEAPLHITSDGPLTYDTVTIIGGQIYVNTVANVKIKNLKKES